MAENKGWLEQSERGSLAAMKAFVWMTLTLGRSFCRLFLPPVCLYFILSSPVTRRSSIDYLRRVLPHPPRWRDVLRHYLAFASTIHDRIYLLGGQFQSFDVAVHGFAEVEEYMRGRACILMGSHLGSFEVLRTLGIVTQSLPINVLAHVANAGKINAVLHALNPAIKSTVIAAGQADTMLKVQECIERKEIVGILSDRIFTGEKKVNCSFLGGRIALPQGPFAVAAILDVPVVLFFGLYMGGNRYDLHFELFEAKPGVERSQRAARVEAWAQRYADRLAYYCRLAPYNWFNFYPYWHE